MKLQTIIASKNLDWVTPDWLIQLLDVEFHFTLDVCASDMNTKVKSHYFTERENGLVQDWSNDVCWMNPPYGNKLKKWVRKAFDESRKGATVVCLLPVRAETGWYKELCLGHEIRFIRGKLKFDLPTTFIRDDGVAIDEIHAASASMIVILRPSDTCQIADTKIGYIDTLKEYRA